MIQLLPSINATLNATSAVLLVWGYMLIRRKQVQTHRKVMLDGLRGIFGIPGVLSGLSLPGGFRALSEDRRACAMLYLSHPR